MLTALDTTRQRDRAATRLSIETLRAKAERLDLVGAMRARAAADRLEADLAEMAAPCDACPTPASCSAVGCCGLDEGGPVSTFAAPAMVPMPCQQCQADAGASGRAAHTPGPWTIEDDDESPADCPFIPVCAGLSSGGSRTIAEIRPTLDDREVFVITSEDRANAKLIAAALDLLAELRDARDNGLIYWEPNTERGHVAKAAMLARIDAVLARAEGRQS